MDFNVINYGAEPNSVSVQTSAFQLALDTCHKNGGGTVVVPAGTYVIGSIRLYSHTRLKLKSAAILRGSQELEDYQTFGQNPAIKYLKDPFYIKAWNLPTYYFHALIAAYDAEDVAIKGEPGSLIDGNSVRDPNGEEHFRGPMGIVFSNVTRPRLTGYTFVNSSNWSHLLSSCQDVEIDHVSVFGGHDGFNLHHSEHIKITQCNLQTGDDCLAGYDISHLYVSRCFLNTSCNIGRLSGRDIQIISCNSNGPGEYPHLATHTYNTHSLLKYYALSSDPNQMPVSDLTFENIQIGGIDRVMLYREGDMNSQQDGLPLGSLTFKNIIITKIKETSYCLTNGTSVSLFFNNCQISPPNNGLFLEIDEGVTVRLTQVLFPVPTTIKISHKRSVTLEGLVTMDIN